MSKIFQVIAICGCMSVMFVQNSFGHEQACKDYFKDRKVDKDIWECCDKCVKDPNFSDGKVLGHCIRHRCLD